MPQGQHFPGNTSTQLVCESVCPNDNGHDHANVGQGGNSGGGVVVVAVGFTPGF